MNPVQVRARTWCRVDFAGGTLDIWPLGLFHPGAVTVNLAIDIATEVTLRPAPGDGTEYRLVNGRDVRTTRDPTRWWNDPATSLAGHMITSLELEPLEVELRSGSPRGGGLGASSALAVGFIAAAEKYLRVAETSIRGRCRFARDIEARMMSLPTGLQDHLPALCGGLMAIHHEPGGERVEKLGVDLEALGDCLIVAYSGQSHFSAGNNWRIVRSRLDGDSRIVGRFEEIAQTALEVAEAFRGGDFEAVGRLMSREWSKRRLLAEGISTEFLESMLRTAVERGAWGGKVCGAGGGGCVVVLAPPEKRNRVAAALAEVAEVLPAAPCGKPFELTSS